MANKVVAAAIVATIAFWAYTQTLLPGVDLGDTGGFQAGVLWPEVSAREAYPLYYNLARPFVRSVSAANPARGLNLFSAVFGSAAVGLLTLLCALVTESLAAGVVAGLMLAPRASLETNFGFTAMITAFAAAVIGGFGRFAGVIVGALVLGLVEQLGTQYVAYQYKAVYPFARMILIVAILPRGVLGSTSRVRV